MKKEKIILTIATDFTIHPGARYIKDGEFSGEEFYKDILKPKYQQAISSSKILMVDMDGTLGYASSFISEAFGRLYKEFGEEEIWKNLEFKSEDNNLLIELIHEYSREYIL